MKKTITLILVLIFAMSLFAACGDKGGGSGGGSGSDSSNSSSSSGNGDKGSSGPDKPGKDEPREIPAPGITVNPGDTVISNDFITISYVGLGSDNTYVYCRARPETAQFLTVEMDADPLVINGIVTDYKDLGMTMMRPYEGKPAGTADLPIIFDIPGKSALEKAGITIEELKTVQATLTISDFDAKEVLLEITVLFNIEHGE